MTEAVKSPLEMFYRWERETPDRVYLRQPKNLQWTEYTWAEVADHARRIASFLKSKNYPAGSRIGIWSSNSKDWPIVDLAIMLAGHISVPIYPGQDTTSARYIFEHSQTRLVFTGSFDQAANIADALLPGMETVAMLGCTIDAHTSLEDIVEQYPPYEESPIPDPEDIFTLIYTSGTTGNPKGVLYSHRSNVLHGLMCNQPDVLGVNSSDNILPIVPMFHANAWAITYAVPAAGASMIMPGAGMDGKSIYELLDSEKVTASAAVPTVWLGLLQYLADNNLKLPYLDKVLIGGAACPRMMIETLENDYDVEVIHGWGMTEMSPVGTTGKLKHATEHLRGEDRVKLKLKQGRTPYLVEMKIVDDDHNDLPRDGVTSGHLLVRGPAVSSGYYKLEDNILDKDGWFDTGDIANIDELGYMQITDRDKDVIKSGGEWISSIEIENAAVGCDGVAEAAVIGIAHPKWTERPLLIIVRKPGSDVSGEAILAYLDGKIATWWMPDAVEFIDEIPHTATGKIQKMTLREQFGGYSFKAAD